MFPSALGIRPGSVGARVHVEQAQAATSADATLYTVPAGRILWVCSLSVNALNTANAVGELQILDGVGGVLHFSILMAATTGNATSTGPLVLPFSEPKNLAVAFRVHIASGTLTWSGSFTGYTEPA